MNIHYLRAAKALELHQPAGHHRGNQARQNCRECGFPHPCMTRLILTGAQK